MRFIALTCEALARPVYASAARSPHIIDVELVPRHLHQPVEIRNRLQSLIEENAGKGYEAMLMGFGLCGQATAGLKAADAPLVVPRAHDCITLYLGDRKKYLEENEKEPGTYWYAQDYIERNAGKSGALTMGASTGEDAQALYAHYVEKYGQAKADRLMAVMGEWMNHYKRAVYLDMGLGGNGSVEAQAREEAERRGWAYERMQADLNLIQRLLDGTWLDPQDEDFLVVQPGEQVGMSYDEGILKTCPAARDMASEADSQGEG